jgi:hypothetical protein
MKTDRSVKIMLVVIAGLLFLNYFSGSGGNSIFPGTKVEASVPTFFETSRI